MRIHFAGAGGCVEYVARRLIREGHDLCLLEKSENRCRELAESLDARLVHGDAALIADWRRADLADSNLFVACTDSDHDNLLACLIADDLAPQAIKLVRLRGNEYETWQQILQRRGVRVESILHPELDVLRRILRVLTVPGIADLREFAGGEIRVFEMNVVRGGPLAGRSILELRQLGLLEQARVCFVFRRTEVIVPGDETTLRPGDHAYLVTTREHLEGALARLGIVRQQETRSAFLVGGGEMGMELARALNDRGISVKLFEQNAKRCEWLAGQLPDITVLNMDGTDQDVLINENIEGVDAFIPVTGSDEANLIASLLARRLGARKVIPLLNRISYLPVAERLGISTSVSPRIKAADAILQYIRQGGVMSVRTLGDEHAEAIELVVPADAGYAGKTIVEAGFPAGALLGAIMRDGRGAFLPDDQEVIQIGDRLVLFAKEEVIRQLESGMLRGHRRSWL